ncbi:MAG: hypothetical protein Q9190_000956 [Brigantiaea leucoxantha]
MVHITEADIAYQKAHVRDDRSQDIVVSHAICIALAAIAILLRFVSRRLGKVAVGADDWMIVAAFVFVTGEVIGGLLCVHYNGGKHAILLTNPAAFAKVVIATEVLYNPAIACVKFSFLLLYRRVFPGRNFHIVLWLIGTIVFVYSWIIVLTAIFQCRPIQAAWDITITDAKCIKFNVEVVIFAVFNVITDVAILILPIPVLWKLQIPMSKKIQLMGVFLTGGFVCVVSAYRISKEASLSLADAPWSDVDACVWSVVEVCVGIVSACLPTMRPLVLRLFSSATPVFHPRSRFFSLGSKDYDGQRNISPPIVSQPRVPQEAHRIDMSRMALHGNYSTTHQYSSHGLLDIPDLEKSSPPRKSSNCDSSSEEIYR